MRHFTRLRYAAAIVALCCFPGLQPHAQAQGSDRSREGKIDEVERDARKAARSGDKDGDGAWSWGVEIAADAFRALFAAPEGYGRGYLRYPYARSRHPSPFVLDDVNRGRRFVTVGVQRFGDAESTSLRATTVSVEGATSALHYAFEYSHYSERVLGDRDDLVTARAGLGGTPRVGTLGFARVGVGLRAIFLDNGRGVIGPDIELGLHTFPVKPLGVSAVARVGAVNWSASGGSGGWRRVVEVSPAVSVFLGRIELRAGWHELAIGRASPFSGPTLGTRLWF